MALPAPQILRHVQRHVQVSALAHKIRGIEMLRRNRWAPHLRVHLAELRREPLQDFVHHAADRAQRMILAHSLHGGNVAEHVSLLLIGSSHAPLDAPCAVSLHNFRLFNSLLKPELADVERIALRQPWRLQVTQIPSNSWLTKKMTPDG